MWKTWPKQILDSLPVYFARQGGLKVGVMQQFVVGLFNLILTEGEDSVQLTDLLVLTSLDQLRFILNTIFVFYPNEEANRTRLFPISWFSPVALVSTP